MLKVAIVDDQYIDVDRLKYCLDRFEKEQLEKIHIEVFSDALLFLDAYKPVYDIVFMDIDMPGMDGLKAAQRLREVDNQVALIFVTNLAKYAINGYEVRAIDFIVKPIQYTKFEFKLKRAIQMLPKEDTEVLPLKSEKGLVYIEVKDIYYVEVLGHELTYHTKKGKFTMRGSLKQLETELKAPMFYTCNKCYIVNLAYVESIQGNVAVIAGDELTISRAKKKGFGEALTDFYNFSRGGK